MICIVFSLSTLDHAIPFLSAAALRALTREKSRCISAAFGERENRVVGGSGNTLCCQCVASTALAGLGPPPPTRVPATRSAITAEVPAEPPTLRSASQRHPPARAQRVPVTAIFDGGRWQRARAQGGEAAAHSSSDIALAAASSRADAAITALSLCCKGRPGGLTHAHTHLAHLVGDRAARGHTRRLAIVRNDAKLVTVPVTIVTVTNHSHTGALPPL